MAKFKRTKEVNQLFSYIGNRKVNVVTGLRKSGKSYLLKTLFVEELIKNYNYTNKEIKIYEFDAKDILLRKDQDLLNELNKCLNNNEKIVILDEVQEVSNYSDVLKSFSKTHNEISFFITGSNSKLISFDIINAFQEACKEVHINPLTYDEIKEEMKNYNFTDYLIYGGIPDVVNATNKRHALEEIKEEIYVKDFCDKYMKRLKYLSKSDLPIILETVASSVTAVSITKISEIIIKKLPNKKEIIPLINKEVKDLLANLEDCYFLTSIDNEDINNKTPLGALYLDKKYYFVDNGLRYLYTKKIETAEELNLENIVFLELKRKGFAIKRIIELDKHNSIIGEIDFKCTENNINRYLQVVHTLNDNNTLRETRLFNKYKTLPNKTILYLNNNKLNDDIDDSIAMKQII